LLRNLELLDEDGPMRAGERDADASFDAARQAMKQS